MLQWIPSFSTCSLYVNFPHVELHMGLAHVHNVCRTDVLCLTDGDDTFFLRCKGDLHNLQEFSGHCLYLLWLQYCNVASIGSANHSLLWNLHFLNHQQFLTAFVFRFNTGQPLRSKNSNNFWSSSTERGCTRGKTAALFKHSTVCPFSKLYFDTTLKHACNWSTVYCF